MSSRGCLSSRGCRPDIGCKYGVDVGPGPHSLMVTAGIRGWSPRGNALEAKFGQRSNASHFNSSERSNNLFESLLRVPGQTQVASLGGALCLPLRVATTNKANNLLRTRQQRLTSSPLVLTKISYLCDPPTNIGRPFWHPEPEPANKD